MALCLAALSEARKVQFDYNLINMQSPNLASVVFEQKLINSADKSLLYGAIVATNLDQAIALGENNPDNCRQWPTLSRRWTCSTIFSSRTRGKNWADPGHQAGGGAVEIQRAGPETGECQ